MLKCRLYTTGVWVLVQWSQPWWEHIICVQHLFPDDGSGCQSLFFWRPCKDHNDKRFTRRVLVSSTDSERFRKSGATDIFASILGSVSLCIHSTIVYRHGRTVVSTDILGDWSCDRFAHERGKKRRRNCWTESFSLCSPGSSTPALWIVRKLQFDMCDREKLELLISTFQLTALNKC